jgi:hypothetical protein
MFRQQHPSQALVSSVPLCAKSGNFLLFDHLVGGSNERQL